MPDTATPTIRNLDEHAHRELKARAALSGKTIGELVIEAIRAYPRGWSFTDAALVTAARRPRTERWSRPSTAVFAGSTVSRSFPADPPADNFEPCRT